MTVTLDLTEDEVHVLQEIAQKAETTVEAVLHALIAQVSLSSHAEAEDTEAEDTEAVTERRREQEEVEANIRRWHEERAAR